MTKKVRQSIWRHPLRCLSLLVTVLVFVTAGVIYNAPSSDAAISNDARRRLAIAMTNQASAQEVITALDLLDATPGTATASKALVLGSSKEIATITTATITNATITTATITNATIANQEGVPERYRLTWVGGARGKPGIDADIQASSETTRMVTDPNFMIGQIAAAANGSSDDITYYAEGGITLQTDGADGDPVTIEPHIDANQSAWKLITWGTDKEVRYDCTITTGSAITTSIVYAGLKLTDTPVTVTDADQVFFRYENDVNSGKWQAISSGAAIGADDVVDSGITVVASTTYHFTIIISAARTATMFINGVLVDTTDALDDATDLLPIIGIEEDGASGARTLYIHNQAISRTIN